MAQICPFCGSQIALVARHVLYPEQSGWLYLCVRFPDCDSRVGCHPGTIVPLGSLADPELRQLRSLCHQQFDQLWRSGRQSRSQAYRWLAEAMGLPPQSAHFGCFDKTQCKVALTHIQSYKEQP
ncbi:MAG: zinc-finger-containing protein [Elainella sp.]